ncbi:MAG: hypothetical protein NTZ67_08315 [Gammaproteobacteria bacterium]|nr:hypothetical protein [Gammaproteobacteria bacterium]
MSIVIFIVLLIIEIGCAVFMRSLAKKRGANTTVWFIVGLILGPFAFIFIPFIKNRKL